MDLLETGIPNLDRILGGGLPERDQLLVVGPAGAGKTTLGLQMVFHAAACGKPAIYVSTVSEPPNKLLRHSRAFRFVDEALIGRQLFLVSLYPLIKQDLEKALQELARQVKEQQAALVVIDGLMAIRDLHAGTPQLRTFFYDLAATLSNLDCTTVMLSSGIESPARHHLPEFTMADAVIELGMQGVGTQTLRTLQMVKLRGQRPLLGQHALQIDAEGVTVFPRIESIFTPEDAGLSTQRVPLGLPELDALMEGGPSQGTVTLLTGAMGIGKTLACLHYLVEGFRRGEKGLMVSFRETPNQLRDKARAFGLELERALDEGQVSILYRPAVDIGLDEVSWEIHRQVTDLGPRRVALDSLVELEQAIFDKQRRFGYLAAFLGLLRNQGSTALMTREVAREVGPELDFSDTPLALLAENLLLLRHVQFENELYRILSVLKMRESSFDPGVRQYTITDQGLKVLSKEDTARGVLASIAHWPAGTRIKRQPDED